MGLQVINLYIHRPESYFNMLLDVDRQPQSCHGPNRSRARWIAPVVAGCVVYAGCPFSSGYQISSVKHWMFSCGAEHLPSKKTLGKEEKERPNGIPLSATNSLTSPLTRPRHYILTSRLYPLPPNAASGRSFLGIGPLVLQCAIDRFCYSPSSLACGALDGPWI